MERQLAEKRIQQEKELKSAKDTFRKEKDGIIEQLKKENASLIRQIQDSKSELTQAENILEQLQERISEKREELDTILDNITDAEATQKKIVFYDQFQKQYQLLSKIDPSRARHLSDEIQYMSRLKDLTRNR